MRFVGGIRFRFQAEVRSEMIRVTRINHAPFLLNPDLIEHVDSTPDTVISLTNGQKYVVTETPDEVVDKVVEYRRRVQRDRD